MKKKRLDRPEPTIDDARSAIVETKEEAKLWSASNTRRGNSPQVCGR